MFVFSARIAAVSGRSGLGAMPSDSLPATTGLDVSFRVAGIKDRALAAAAERRLRSDQHKIVAGGAGPLAIVDRANKGFRRRGRSWNRRIRRSIVKQYRVHRGRRGGRRNAYVYRLE